MSEITTIALIKGNTLKIHEIYKKKKVKGYLLPINQQWSGIAIEEGMEQTDNAAKMLSKMLDTFAFGYFYNEDYYWSYQLYEKGKKSASFYVNFEEDEDQVTNANLTLLKSIACKPQHLDEMERLLAEDYIGRDLLLMDSFKRAFQFEKVEWLSFENLEKWTSEELDRNKVIAIQSSGKTKSFREKVKLLFGDLLAEFGFLEEEELVDQHIRFTKIFNDFYYTIHFDIGERNTLRLLFLVPNGSDEISQSLMDKNLNMRLEYKKKQEIDFLLEQHGILFIKNAYEYMLQHPIEIENIDLPYKSACDPFFEKFGFKRVFFTPDIIQGGEVIYQKEDISFIIKHKQGYARFDSRVLIGKERYSMDALISDTSAERGLGISQWEYFSFRNEEEFLKQLKRLFAFIEWLLNEGIENVIHRTEAAPTEY